MALLITQNKKQMLWSRDIILVDLENPLVWMELLTKAYKR